MKKYVFFDFDGTLFETGEGITACVEYALFKMNFPPLSYEERRTFIGPALYDSFQLKSGMTPEQSEEAVTLFREKYWDDGYKKSRIYEGIPGLLKKLKENGITACITSAKPGVLVDRILSENNMQDAFSVRVTADPSVKHSSKAGLIEKTIEMLGNPDKSECIMIGDRCFDIDGAKAVGLDSVYCLYGYGTKEEMEECKPSYFVNEVGELFDLIMRA